MKLPLDIISLVKDYCYSYEHQRHFKWVMSELKDKYYDYISDYIRSCEFCTKYDFPLPDYDFSEYILTH